MDELIGSSRMWFCRESALSSTLRLRPEGSEAEGLRTVDVFIDLLRTVDYGLRMPFLIL